MGLRGITLFRLMVHHLLYYWRINCIIVSGIILISLTLTGALLVGDSLRATLHHIADERLGTTEYIITSYSGKLFTERLFDSFNKRIPNAGAPILLKKGSMSTDGGRRRVNRVNICGIDRRFWSMWPNDSAALTLSGSETIVNHTIARKLGIASGDEVLLRFDRGERLPMEAPFSGGKQDRVVIRLKVKAVVDGTRFGNFSLKAEHGPVYNVFLPLRFLADISNQSGRISAILLHGAGEKLDSVQIKNTIENCWRIADGGVHLRLLEAPHCVELYTDDIFIPQKLRDEIVRLIPDASEIYTYFVNSIEVDEKSIPYSFVSTAPVNSALSKNEIVLSRWAADDCNASIGDTCTIRYFIPSAGGGLNEEDARFIVSIISPMTLPWADSTLTPQYPGLADAENCTKWDAGIPIDLDRIRPQDERYWQNWRGTPKAFIGIDAARKKWKNRFGVCTAIRFPLKNRNAYNIIEQKIRSLCAKEFSSIAIIPIKEKMEKAVDGGVDFAPLFTGLSLFIIVAAMILASLLFGLSFQRQGDHYRIYAAAGFPRGKIIGMHFLEGGVLIIIGTLLGAILSQLYTSLLLKGLQSMWQAAAPVQKIYLASTIRSFAFGILSSILIAAAVLLFAIHIHTKEFFRINTSAPLLLPHKNKWKKLMLLLIAGGTIAVTIVLLLYAGNAGTNYSAGAYFGIGACMITSIMSSFYLLLEKIDGNRKKYRLSTFTLALLTISRDRKRAVGTAAIIGCSLFIIGAMTVFKHDSITEPHLRSGPSGGFNWFGTLTKAASAQQLTTSWLHKMGCDECDSNVIIIPMRLKEGDDASCFNLNAVTQPPLVGVSPYLLKKQKRFSFTRILSDLNQINAWDILDVHYTNSVIPGVADQNVIEWGLGKKIGDTLHYVNEAGMPLDIVLVGSLNNSIFQGQVLISEKNFIKHFPTISGYHQFCAEVPVGKEKIIGKALQTIFIDNGVECERTETRLAAFNAMENTYINIFTLLGLLGLLFGCVGLGIIVIHNATVRQQEFSLLRTHGFLLKTIRQLIYVEQAVVFVGGVTAGLLSALVAILPSFTFTNTVASLWNILIMIVTVMVVGLCSIWIAVRISVGKEPMQILQRE